MIAKIVVKKMKNINMNTMENAIKIVQMVI